MTTVDLWASFAAAVACIATGLRAEMLKPEISSFANAPAWVHAALTVLSIALALAAISIFGSGVATTREALTYTVLAVVSVILLGNLHRQRPTG